MVAEIVLLSSLAGGAPSSMVTVESATTCPGAAEVDKRLRAILPPLPAGASPDRVAIDDADGRLRVRLWRADATPVVERQLEASASCADLANVVAVIVAAWEAHYRPELLPAPALPPATSGAPPTSTSARTAPPATAARPTIGARPTAAALPANPPVTPEAARASPPGASASTAASAASVSERRSPVAVEVGAAALVSFAAFELAPGGAVRVVAWPGALGVRVALAGAAPRRLELGDGEASWSRLALAGGAAYRLGPGAFLVDVHASLAAGLVLAEGTRHEVNRSDAAWAWGLGAGVDLSYPVGPIAISVGVGALVWPVRQELVVAPAGTATRALSRVEGQLTLGVAYVL